MNVRSIIKKIQRWHDVDGGNEYTVAISPLNTEKQYHEVRSQIISALKLQKNIQERAKNPMAMNYLQFEAWIKGIIEESKKGDKE